MTTRMQYESLPTRASLLERIKDWGDERSWRDFYDTYWRLIRNVALKAGLSDAEAQEVLQETVIAVANEIKDFHYDPARGSFKAWLMNQTRWRIAGQHRIRRKNQRFNNASAETLLEQVPDPVGPEVSQDLWDREWHENALAVAKERVKERVEPRTFQIYDLYASKEWPVARVAQSLGVSRAQVYVAKSRVGRQIKAELKRLARQESLSPEQVLGTGRA